MASVSPATTSAGETSGQRTTLRMRRHGPSPDLGTNTITLSTLAQTLSIYEAIELVRDERGTERLVQAENPLMNPDQV